MPYQGNLSEKRRRETNRRSIIGIGGFVGVMALSGCLGDDEEEIEDADDVDDEVAADDDVADDTDDPDDDDVTPPADDEDDDEPEEIVRYDVGPYNTMWEPFPADAQYSPWSGDPIPPWQGESNAHFQLANRSNHDQVAHSRLFDWQYEPGILEIDLRDDFYWWSGDQMVAEDLVTYFQLQDWAWGGEDLDAHPELVAYEEVGEFSVRFALADTWREEWALQQVVIDESFWSNQNWNTRWNEVFEDTGGDMDAIEDVREDLNEHRVDTDEELVDFFRIPFEFRLDESIGEIGENHWRMDLVPEKNGNPRGFTDVNYNHIYHWAFEETGEHANEHFLNQDQPELYQPSYGEDADEDPDFPWNYRKESWSRNEHGEFFNWNFNAEVHPTDNPFFRRAWCFMTDRSDWATLDPTYTTNELAGPFVNDEWNVEVFSDDIIEAWTSYGPEEVMPDRAAQELETGGFERDAEGNWLNQEEGEPISIDIGNWDWGGLICDGGTDFTADLEEFGIEAECLLDHPDPWTVNGGYHGGLLPENAFSSIFGEINLGWGQTWNNGFPETVEAPEVGDTDADPDDWVEYDTRTMTDRLGVTTDEESYQAMVDELGWVFNQILPRYQVIEDVQVYIMNDERWHVDSMEDHPEKWLRAPKDQLWISNGLAYVPEEER